MGEIVFGEGEDKCRVDDFVIPIVGDSFCGGKNRHGPFGCLDRGLASRQTDETLIKIIEPRAHYLWAVARRVGRDKNYLDLCRNWALSPGPKQY